MLLGRVIGTLVPACVYEGLEGVPMLWVQPLDKRREPEGRPLVCADGTRMAGPGETIFFVASREAALTLDPWFVPVDHAVVGIVDGHVLEPELEAEAAPAGGASSNPGRASSDSDVDTSGRRGTGGGEGSA